MDLYMWELRLDKVEEKGGFHPMIHAAAKKVTGEHGVTVRNMRKRDFEAELGRFLEVYNAAWEHNWGFVPLDEKEVRHYAKDLKPILDENWTWIAERDGEVLGAALTLPDINGCLAHMNGRLLPFGWAKFLWYRRKIDGCRVFALGVKPEYQDLGIAAAFYIEHIEQRRPEPKRHLVGRDGLDPRDERGDEPRDGGHGRQDRQALPDLREGARGGRSEADAARGLEHGRGPRRDRPQLPLHCAARCPPIRAPTGASSHAPVPGRAAGRARSSSAAGCCSRCRCRAARVAVAAGGLTAGAVLVTLVRALRRRRRARGRPPPRAASCAARVVGTRSFLVDVHLLGRSSAQVAVASAVATADCRLRTRALRPAAGRS